MNTIYRIVWNVTLGKWVVASELAKGRKKKSSVKTAMLSLAVIGAMAGMAAPSVYAADISMPSCVVGEDPHETGCVPTSSEQLMTPFFADGGGNDFGNANNVAIGNGAVAGKSGVTSYAIAIGTDAKAPDTSNIAIGRMANTTGSNAISLGYNATANGNYSMSLGGGSSALAARATAVGTDTVASGGSATAVGNASKAATDNSVALGNGAQAGLDVDGNPTGKNQTALGYAAKAMASSGTAIGQDASATGATGATAIGWGSKANAAATGGAWSATTVGTNSVANGDGAAALGDSANATGDRTAAFGRGAKASQDDATAFGAGTSVVAVGGTAIGSGAQVAAGANNAVAIGSGSRADRINTVSVGTTAAGGQRQIVNVAKGTAPTDAVNVSQLDYSMRYFKANDGAGTSGDANAAGPGSVAIGTGASSTNTGTATGGGVAVGQLASAINSSVAIGAGAKADPQTGWSSVAIGQSSTATGDGALAYGPAATATAAGAMALGRGATAAIANGVALGNGANVTAAGTGGIALGSGSVADRGNAMSVGSTSVKRQVINVAAGTADTDAVNFSQLKGTAGTVAAALGGGVTVDADGTITKPTYSVQGATHDNVGDALGAVDTTLTSIDGRVTTNEGDIVDIRNQLGSGSIGLVQQDETTRDITVAAGKDGARVDFTGTAGARNLVGVAKGDLSDDSTEAVNGSQLFETNERVTKNEGDIVNLDGRVTKNEGDIVTIGDRVTKNEGDIIDLGDRLNSGSVGLVQQASANAVVTVAAATGGKVVDFTGTDGTRQLKGVSEGSDDTDAVNVAQLRKAGLVGGDGSTLDAVVYDAGSNRGSVTFGGLGGTKLTNVMAGIVSATSTDAVNGSQLWILQDQVSNLGDRVTNIENNGAQGTSPVTPQPAPGTGEGGRDPAFAANGDGGPASATGKDSVAAGTGASATADNSVAIGAGSVADRADTVSVGSAGAERQVSNVAAGTQRTDAANWGQVQDALATANRYTDERFDGVNRRIGEVQRQANRGIAASAALINVTPYMPGKTVLNAGVANYRGESALGVGVSRWNDTGRVNFNAGMSAAAGDSPIFRMGVGVVLGD